QAQWAIAESESFYRQTLESMPVMTLTATADGTGDYVSRQWVELTGIPAEQQHGHRWVRALHPDDQEHAFSAWRAAIQSNSNYDVEYRVRRYDGEYVWFKVRGSAIRDASGEVARWIGTAVNINDLKQTEAALRASEEALKSADRRKDEFLAT